MLLHVFIYCAFHSDFTTCQSQKYDFNARAVLKSLYMFVVKFVLNCAMFKQNYKITHGVRWRFLKFTDYCIKVVRNKIFLVMFYYIFVLKYFYV